MKKVLKITVLGYLALAVACLVVLPALAQGEWPRPSPCDDEKVYNRDFDFGPVGWGFENTLKAIGWGGDMVPELIAYGWDYGFTYRFPLGYTANQNIELSPGTYTINVGMMLVNNSPVRPGIFPDFIVDVPGAETCEAIDAGVWQGEHWGQIRLFWKGTLLATHDIPNGLPHDTYYQFEYPVVITESTAGQGTFKVQYWSPAWCAILTYELNRIDLDWVSVCRHPDPVTPTPTPTVTGTPPDTPTPTATSTVFCESTDYPTGTPYPSSTPYPTNTPWLTPPVLLTQTPLPTYTPWPTCAPTATKTPYASPTPFRFNVPLTYTNQFGELKQGMSEFFSSTEELLGDVSNLLITASVAVSNVTSFGVTNTVTISGTPVTTNDMVTTFVSNLSALRYVFGWFSVFRQLAPGPFWFLLTCIAWTIFVLAAKFVYNFFSTIIWPLARTVWDVVIDIWNAIPFL